MPMPPKAAFAPELVKEREQIVLLNILELPLPRKEEVVLKLALERWFLAVRLYNALVRVEITHAGRYSVIHLLTAMGGGRGIVYRKFRKLVLAAADKEVDFLFDLFTQWEIGGEDGKTFSPSTAMNFLCKLIDPNGIEAVRINRWFEHLPFRDLEEVINFRFYHAKSHNSNLYSGKTVLEWKRFWFPLLSFVKKLRDAGRPVMPALIQFAKVKLRDDDGRREIVREFDNILGYVSEWPGEEEPEALTETPLRKEFHKDLADLAIVSGASKIIGVALSTVQNAIAKGKLASFPLADGTLVVSLAECRKLWAEGVSRGPGRPRTRSESAKSDIAPL